MAIDAPVAETERIEAIDLLRGVAVLGILLVNMQWFAMPNAAAVNPYALGQPSPTDLNIWSAIELFAESKFITIFSLLFGAGVVLMTDRLEGRGVSPGRVHYRRMVWLLVFGLVHAYVLWHGDILVLYAICGMLLYPLRRLSVRTLVTLGVAALAVGMLSALAGQFSWPSWPDEARGEWLAYWQPSMSAIAAETAAFQGGWLAQEPWRAGFSAEFHLQDMPSFDLWHVGGLMLLGMALLKSGVLTGRKTRRQYVLQGAIGLACGLPLVAWGLYQFQRVNWRLPDSLFIIPLWNYWGSILVALGYIGLLLTIWKAGVMRGIVSRLTAVGRMAFSSYILETLICTTIFYGHGLGLFGTVDRLQQLLLTIVIWIVLLILAPVWLLRFRYGPLEWLWRTLTYGHRVPMRRSEQIASRRSPHLPGEDRNGGFARSVDGMRLMRPRPPCRHSHRGAATHPAERWDCCSSCRHPLSLLLLPRLPQRLRQPAKPKHDLRIRRDSTGNHPADHAAVHQHSHWRLVFSIWVNQFRVFIGIRALLD